MKVEFKSKIEKFVGFGQIPDHALFRIVGSERVFFKSKRENGDRVGVPLDGGHIYMAEEFVGDKLVILQGTLVID